MIGFWECKSYHFSFNFPSSPCHSISLLLLHSPSLYFNFQIQEKSVSVVLSWNSTYQFYSKLPQLYPWNCLLLGMRFQLSYIFFGIPNSISKKSIWATVIPVPISETKNSVVNTKWFTVHGLLHYLYTLKCNWYLSSSLYLSLVPPAQLMPLSIYLKVNCIFADATIFQAGF